MTAPASRGSKAGIENGLGRLGDESEDVEKETGERGGDPRHGADARSPYASEEFASDPSATTERAPERTLSPDVAQLGKPCQEFR